MARVVTVGATSAAAPLATPQARNLFRLATGARAGRAVVIYRPNPGTLALAWADAPYKDWSSPVTVASDVDGSGFAACMHPDGSLTVAYTKISAQDLVCCKLLFDGETWQPLAQQTIYTGDANTDPSLAYEEGQGRIWVSWTRSVAASGLSYIQSKRSLDGGTTWGLGPTDTGDTLTTGSSTCRSQLVRRLDFMHCVYQDGGSRYAHRSFYLNSALWSGEETILTGSGFASGFHAAAAGDGRLGVVMASGAALQFREYDGSSWSAVLTVRDATPLSPTALYIDQTPIALWGEDQGSGYRVWWCASKSGVAFSDPTPLLGTRAVLDRVLLYSDASANPFADLSAAAAEDTAADMVHPETGKLVAAVGDAVYFGLSEPFDLLNIVLASPGTGGVVKWEYWNGSIWQAFVPATGPCHFDSSPMRVRLFDDGWATPDDWHATSVNSTSLYWVRARVVSAFATSPVGTQAVTGDATAQLQSLSGVF